MRWNGREWEPTPDEMKAAYRKCVNRGVLVTVLAVLAIGMILPTVGFVTTLFPGFEPPPHLLAAVIVIAWLLYRCAAYCPVCGRWLRAITTYTLSGGSKSSYEDFCPYCGADLKRGMLPEEVEREYAEEYARRERSRAPFANKTPVQIRTEYAKVRRRARWRDLGYYAAFVYMLCACVGGWMTVWAFFVCFLLVWVWLWAWNRTICCPACGVSSVPLPKGKNPASWDCVCESCFTNLLTGEQEVPENIVEWTDTITK